MSDLWAEYKETGARASRDRLIEQYAPLVKVVASKMVNGLPSFIQQDDLVSYGVFGLLDAIDKFDPDRNIKFETYAMTRIKGAIIDELRSIDWAPRSLRSKGRAVETAYAKLESDLLRTPTSAELARELGVSSEELDSLVNKMATVNMTSLNAPHPELPHADHGDAIYTLGDSLTAVSPEAELDVEDMQRLLAVAISDLNEREKVVLTLYYYEGLTLAEIGQVLAVTESRVCQVHTKLILKLRRQIELLPVH